MDGGIPIEGKKECRQALLLSQWADQLWSRPHVNGGGDCFVVGEAQHLALRGVGRSLKGRRGKVRLSICRKVLMAGEPNSKRVNNYLTPT